MLKKEEFVRRILDGARPAAKAESSGEAPAGILDGFDSFDVPDDSQARSQDARFAQLLLEESGFGRGETLPRGEVVLGDQKTNRFLPHGATYWPKTTERPFHILLFDLDAQGSAILGDSFFRQNDQLEDALHRIVQDALEGFERGGEGRTADRKKGSQSETLCVVSVVDDRGDGPVREMVCFGTKCTATDALEVFTLREEARDWDRPLAEEHLGQLFERHFKRLGTGARWQDAFVSGEERNKARRLMDECTRVTPDEKQLQTAIRDLLDEIARSFGLRRKGGRGGHRLVMHALPEDHSIAVDPDDARKDGFRNPFQGLRIFDAEERLIGYIVYVLDTKSEAERLRRQLAQHNHFHNVLVVYPEEAGATLELWQGTEPLRGRLIRGTRRSRFDGEGGVVQLLSRFFVVSRSAIATPRQLATELAWRAQHLRALALDELHEEKGKSKTQQPLRDLLAVFNKALATLKEEEFADAYAQTITYGLLAARWLSSSRDDVRFTRKNIDALLPSTSPFLHDLFQRLINSRFDQNLSWLLDDITSLLSRTMVAEVFQGEQDPSIHFYQDFLDAYDPQIRKEQGVYYTPDEVVSYIVRTVHEVLQDQFGLPLGLADTTTWADFARAADVDVPEGVDRDEPFVQILDPATGTGTFLLRVIEVVHETMMAAYRERGLDETSASDEWTRYVRAHLLPRLNGFELMMAPYIVSHLRLGLALEQTGFAFGGADRLRVFLTNSLEPASSAQEVLLPDFVSRESMRANRLKEDGRITVVTMNPPYARHSSNFGQWITRLVADYKKGFPELDKPAQGKALADDYVKFIRLAQHHIGRSGVGCASFISNHGFLTNPTFRGLRKRLLEECSTIDIVDLDGNSRRRDLDSGEVDENVFNIQQGVAIATLVRAPSDRGRERRQASVKATRVTGSREDKFVVLQERAVEMQVVDPRAPNFLLTAAGGDDQLPEWEGFTSIPKLMSLYGDPAPGFVTTHDEFAISWSRGEAIEKVESLLRTASEEEARRLFRLCTTNQWCYATAKSTLSRDTSWRDSTELILYRPFDWRFTVWNEHVNVHRRDRAFAHMRSGVNLALVTVRQVTKGDFAHALVSRVPSELKLASHDRNSQAFPLWLYDKPGGRRRWNYDEIAASQLGFSLVKEADAVDLFHVVYALLHSPIYRKRYRSRLRAQPPAIPPVRDPELQHELGQIGADLVATHTLEPQYPSASWIASGLGLAPWLEGTLELTGDERPRVERGYPKHVDDRVLLNKSTVLRPISKEVWEFGIGGYPVLKKWLKSRARRQLTQDEVVLLQHVAGAVAHTMKLMQEVDRIVDHHGGWPSAFARNGA